MEHVLARVSGFGWTIVPRYPFRFERVEDTVRALRVEHGGATPKRATVSTHTACEWVELAYEHDGRTYWRRHATVRWAPETLLVLTAQAGADQSTSARSAASFALDTLEAWRE